MPNPLGFALSTELQLQIVSMYSSSDRSVLAVDTEPGWNVIGAFPMPISSAVQLDVIGSVSDESLTMTARLYCVTPGFVGEVSGSRVQLSSTVDVEVFSGKFNLTGARLYQVQVQVVGNSGDDFFGLVRRAAPVGA